MTATGNRQLENGIREPGSGPAMADRPLVSVIVAARDSASTLPACLRALASQDYSPVEVIVVDDGSKDDTAAIAEAHAARVVRTPPVGASSARNLGIEVARGAIVAFTDGDCVADRGWASALVHALETSGATGVGGRQINVFPRSQAFLRDGFEAFFRAASIVSDYTRGDRRPRQVRHNASCCSAYHVGPVRDIGGFTAGLWPGEDVDLDLRLAARGATFHYVPTAVVHHHRPGTFGWFRNMMRRYGAAERRLVRRHGRARAVDYMPVVTTVLVLAQCLLLLPAVRGAVVALDAILALLGLGALWSTTPVRLWPAVIAFGITAMWEWHLGWWTSPQETA